MKDCNLNDGITVIQRCNVNDGVTQLNAVRVIAA